MLSVLRHLLVVILGNLAACASLVVGIFTIAALAIAGTIPDIEYVEILEFDPQTLRNRRRRLRPLPTHQEIYTPPPTPPIQAQEVQQEAPEVPLPEPVREPNEQPPPPQY